MYKSHFQINSIQFRFYFCVQPVIIEPTIMLSYLSKRIFQVHTEKGSGTHEAKLNMQMGSNLLSSDFE